MEGSLPSYDNLDKPGVHEIALIDRVGVVTRFDELRRLGHAITMDYVYDTHQQLSLLRVHHYRSCVACGEAQRAKPL
jgi:hypothetical protein